MEIENYKTEELNIECNRCHQLPTEFICDECYKGNYCSNCDKYMHSLSSKKNHKRRILTEANEEHSPQIPLLPEDEAMHKIKKPPSLHPMHSSQPSSSLCESNHILNKTKTVSQSYINEIKQIYQGEKEELMAQISVLNKKLHETTKDLNERIEFLHSHVENVEKKHLNETIINEKKWNKQLDEILIEKENQTEFLYDKIHTLEETIKEQGSKIKEYEELLNTTISNYKNQLALANCHVEEVIKENVTIKEFYKKRLDEVAKSTEEEKNRLIAQYEKSLEQLNEGYQSSKQKNILIIQQRESELKELIISNQKDRNELGAIIDNLKESNNNSIKEKEEFIKMTELLKKALDDANESLEKQKKEIKTHIKEKQDLANELEELRDDYAHLEDKNEKANQLMFGRFKQKSK